MKSISYLKFFLMVQLCRIVETGRDPGAAEGGGGSKRVEGDAKLIKSKQIVTMVLLLASVQQER